MRRRPREPGTVNILNPKRTTDPELVRARKLARLLKQLDSIPLVGRTRLATAMGEVAYQARLAQEHLRREKKLANRPKRFQITYEYELYNPVHNRTYVKSLRVIEKSTSNKLGRPGEPGSQDYFWSHHGEHYSAEEQGRITITGISVLDEIINLTPVEPLYQPMNRYVLTSSWLRYASDIDPISLTETSSGCVPTGLTNLLLHPPRGRPTKWIGRWEVTLENVRRLLDILKQTDEKELRDQEGYSSNTVSKLLRRAERNFYAFDSDDNRFLTCNLFETKKHMPIVWYTKHGHFYLVTSKDAILSVAKTAQAEANATAAPPPKVNDELPPDPKQLRVLSTAATESLLEDIATGEVLKLEPGIYIVGTGCLTEEYLTYVSVHRDEGLRVRVNNQGDITEFSIALSGGKKQATFVANPDFGSTETHQAQAAAQSAGIPYTGQSVSQLVRQILNVPHSRKALTTEQKREVIDRQDGLCALCDDPLEEGAYEFDHTHARANGGTNASINFQCLCTTCHRDKTDSELEAGYNFQTPYESVLHPLMHKELQEQHTKMWARVEKFSQARVEETEPRAEVDLIKCRRNLLMGYHGYDWPVYCVMDIPRDFAGKLRTGRYYVHTTCDRGPFRGNGWYYLPDVEYGLELGLICMDDIKLEWIPSKVLPHDYFQPIVKMLLDAFQHDPDLQKLAINSLIGCFARMSNVSTSVRFSLDEHEAGRWCSYPDYEFLQTVHLQDGTPLYMGTFKKQTAYDNTCRPIYDMMVGLEAIQIDRLRTIVAGFVGDGALRALKTDAVQFAEEDSVVSWDLQDYLAKQAWAPNVPKYRYVPSSADPKPLKTEAMAGLVRDHVHPPYAFVLEWTEVPEVNPRANGGSAAVANLLGQGLFIDGPAGYGKTEILNAMISECDRQGLTYLRCAPTNQAAENLNGYTIHFSKRTARKPVNYVFVDEPSMCGEELWRFLLQLKRRWPDAIFVFAGDFDQLKPVNCWWDLAHEGEGDFENCAPFMWLSDMRRMRLTTYRRGDAQLGEVCNELRNAVRGQRLDHVDPNLFPVRQETDINISYVHRLRKRVNAERMAKFVAKKRSVHVPANPKDPKSQDVDLVEGMPVIAHRRWQQAGVKNAARGRVVEARLSHHGEDYLVICLERTGELVEMRASEFHRVWRVGFCITVHQAQCITIDEPFTIYGWNHDHMIGRGRYVAVSRGTRMEYVQIALQHGWDR